MGGGPPDERCFMAKTITWGWLRKKDPQQVHRGTRDSLYCRYNNNKPPIWEWFVQPTTTYKNGDDWAMVYGCFTHITTDRGIGGIVLIFPPVVLAMLELRNRFGRDCAILRGVVRLVSSYVYIYTHTHDFYNHT